MKASHVGCAQDQDSFRVTVPHAPRNDDAKKRLLKGLDTFDRQLGESPQCPVLWANKGMILYHLDRFEEAMECFDRSLGLDGQGVIPNIYKVCILQEFGRFEEAIAWSKRIFCVFEEKPRAFEYREFIDSPESRLPVPDTGFYQGLVLIDFARATGMALARLKRFEEAINQLNIVLKVHPTHIEALLNKALILSRLGQHEKAVDVYNTIPETSVVNDIAWVNKSWELFWAGRLVEALESVEKAIELCGKNYKLLYLSGHILFRMGRIPEALENVRQVMHIAPEFSVAKDLEESILSVLEKQGEEQSEWGYFQEKENVCLYVTDWVLCD